jgi:DUF4097 and DUF4098 domain-containing protein YvlB
MYRRLIPLVLAAAIASPALAQNRADFRWDRAVPAGQQVSIHNINGDIRVTPSTTGRVEVTGIKHGSGADQMRVDVQQTSRGVTICVLYDNQDSYCDDQGMHAHSSSRGDHNWDRGSISLEVTVPANLTLSANSVSGNIAVTGAQGDIAVNSVSGDIELDKLRASSINANTVSGNVTVHVDEFIGRGDLSFHSVSGNVTLDAPRGFEADLSMSTVSGDINSDFPLTLGGNLSGRVRRGNVAARIGNGGRRMDVSTVSGDLRIRMSR